MRRAQTKRRLHLPTAAKRQINRLQVIIMYEESCLSREVSICPAAETKKGSDVQE